VRLGLETVKYNMMHDVYAKTVIIFFEGFIEADCKHCRGTEFYLKIVKILQLVPLLKVRTKPRKKSLIKAKT